MGKNSNLGSVLIVTEDGALRQRFIDLLTVEGYQAVPVEDATGAFALLGGSNPPHTVVLEAHLQDRRAMALLDAIRTEHAHLLVLTIMPRDKENEFVELIMAGAAGCLTREAAAGALVPLLKSTLAVRTAKKNAEASPGAIRQSRRIPAAVPVRIRIGTWDEFETLRTSNVSQGGIFVPLSNPPAIGTSLRIAFELPDHSVAELEGEVARVVSMEQATASGQASGVGIRFSNESEAQRKAISALLSHANPNPATAAMQPPTPSLLEMIEDSSSNLDAEVLFEGVEHERPNTLVPENLAARTGDEGILAERLLAQGNFMQASQAITRVLVREPDNKRWKSLQQVIRGREAQVSGQVERAAEFYERALEIDFRCPEAIEGVRQIAGQKKLKKGRLQKLFDD